MIRFDTKKDYELYNSKIEENAKLQQENKQLKDNWKETQDIWYIKILQKYKKIIGNDINVGSKGVKDE